METQRVYLDRGSKLVASVHTEFLAGESGVVEVANSNAFWGGLRHLDPASKENVPVANDEHGIYFESHWPALVAAARGKKKPAIRLIQQGGGALLTARNASGKKTAAAFELLEMAFQGWDDDHLMEAFVSPGSYADLRVGDRGLLEQALCLRLFRVADWFWDHGLRFSKKALDSGAMVLALSTPLLEGPDSRFSDVLLRSGHAASTGVTRSDPSSRDRNLKAAGEKFVEQTGKWLDRLRGAGSQWNVGHRLEASSGANKPGRFSIQLPWPGTIAKFQDRAPGSKKTIVTFNAESTGLSSKDNDRLREAWVSLWMRHLTELPHQAFLEAVCLDEDIGMQEPVPLTHYLRLIHHDRLASTVDAMILQRETLPGDDDGSRGAAVHRL